MANGNNTNLFRQIYLGVLIYIAISLPLSRSGLTQGMALLFVLWLWSDFQISVALRFFKQKGLFRGFFYLLRYLWALAGESVREKTGKFLKNKPAVVFASIFLLGPIGLIFTKNFSHTFHILHNQVSLLLFPLVFSAFDPLNQKEFKKLLFFYIAAILAGTLIGSYRIFSGKYMDFREFSPFISSMRFGLNISFGIFSLGWFIVKDHKISPGQKIFMAALILWFLWFLVKMESVTSLGIIFLFSLGVLVYLALQSRKKTWMAFLLAVVVLFPASAVIYLKKEIYSMTHAPKPWLLHKDEKTAEGHAYTFDTLRFGIEDGRYVGAYLCLPELKKAWNQRSAIPFNGKDKYGNPVATTLIRYLTSKGLRKDAAGLQRLSDKDIRNIENGIANVHYVVHPGLHSRLLMMVKGWQIYKETGKTGGNSALQRYAFLQAVLQVIKSHFWTGTGTGDLLDALGHQYLQMHSGLENCVGFYSHNQYLDIFAAYGIFGFLWFCFALVYPPLKTQSFKDYFFVAFYVTILLSMLTDDTMVFYAGITLFSFFLSLLMFGKERQPARLGT